MADPGLARSSPQPLHDQIAARLRDAITDGTWPIHHQLPSEPELSRAFDVSRGTIRRALRTLIDAGLLIQVQGKGTFVVGVPGGEQPIVQEVFSLAEALERHGIAFTTQIRSTGLIEADERIADLLHVPPGAPVFRLVRRRAVDGSWVAYLIDYVPPDICPGIERLDLSQRLLFDLIEQDYGLRIEWGSRTYGAETASQEVASELQIPEGSPVLYQEQVTYLHGSRPVEYSEVWIRADRLRLSLTLRRDAGSAERGGPSSDPSRQSRAPSRLRVLID